MLPIYGHFLINWRYTPHKLRDIQYNYAHEEFPGCVGCAACMKIHWKNCPAALNGKYHNSKDGKLAILMVEA